MNSDEHLKLETKISYFVFGVISGLIFFAIFIAAQDNCYGGSSFLRLC